MPINLVHKNGIPLSWGYSRDKKIASVVADGYISIEKACHIYGVVMEKGKVNQAKTRKLREELRRRRRYIKVLSRDLDEYDKRGCRLCCLSKELAGELGVDDGRVIEYAPSIGAPLRAWAKIDDSLKASKEPRASARGIKSIKTQILTA